MVVLDDFSTGKNENLNAVAHVSDLQIIEGSILDRELAAKTLKDVDVVFHQAAIVSVVRSIENPIAVDQVKAGGTLNLLDESRKARVNWFVYASSIGVYGDVKELPIKESFPLLPTNPYAASKAASEQYCMAFNRSYGLSVVCLRYTNVYGPRMSGGPYGGVITKFAERLQANQPPRHT